MQARRLSEQPITSCSGCRGNRLDDIHSYTVIIACAIYRQAFGFKALGGALEAPLTRKINSLVEGLCRALRI